MKKIFAILLIIVFAFMATSCGKKAQNDSSLSGFFVEITSYQSVGSHTEFVYDPFTKVVYLYIQGAYHKALSPYYTIENGEPVIARYGVNWTEANLIR